MMTTWTAISQGIVKINLQGSKEEVPWGDDMTQGEDESVKRIRQNRLSELSPAKMPTRELEENEKAMDKLAMEFQDIYWWCGEIQRARDQDSGPRGYTTSDTAAQENSSTLCQAIGGPSGRVAG